ncbi:hypothetical protein [Streptomyces albus]|uniref:hypothetical protein n=1 Tax=Streptomyces sp. NRRL F-5917 TaxID=1463873 RepID=UPI0004C0C74B|nr:hypothetical protein [Streptomyces sp. NRRL F-5917]
MFTGTPEELRLAERRAQRLADEIAERMTELAKLSPLVLNARGITYLGGRLVQRRDTWTAEADRN